MVEMEGRKCAYWVNRNHLPEDEREMESWIPYEGWSNSSTWCAYLYFTQTSKWIKRMRKLIRKDGTINFDRAGALVYEAEHHPSQDMNCQVDEWCEGEIDIVEFVEEFLRDYSGANLEV